MIIALIGPDGSGKSTYAGFMRNYLKESKSMAKVFYPFNYFLLRKLIDKFARYKEKDKFLQPRKNCSFLFKFWPFIALIDNWIDYLFRLKRFRGAVICDRYYYDLATSFAEFNYSFDWLYHLYLKCIPKPDLCFVFLAPPEVLRNRETGDIHDLSFFENQVERYQKISEKRNFFRINTKQQDMEKCQELIRKIINLRS
ncbi:MAG: hypothetical protein P9M07_01680 [Candidatus Aceula meridiana]|nr:hypothetical protein [Candidatus Aceula meridiana]